VKRSLELKDSRNHGMAPPEDDRTHREPFAADLHRIGRTGVFMSENDTDIKGSSEKCPQKYLR
jgi:hypothetical protein